MSPLAFANEAKPWHGVKVECRRVGVEGDQAAAGRLQRVATRYNSNGSKGVDRITMLVESRPFDPSNALGLCLRRREFDHLAFKV
jgi:hypothetical protein